MITNNESGFEFILVRHEPNVSYQSSVKLSHWSHLNIVQIKSDQILSEEQMRHLTEEMKEFFMREKLPLPIVFFGDKFDVELYGLKLDKQECEGQMELPL